VQIKQKYQYYLMPFLVILCFSFYNLPTYAETPKTSDNNRSQKNKLLSAYLVGFIKFIEYPEHHSIYNYCIAASEELVQLVIKGTARVNFERKVNVFAITPEYDLTKCQILFISDENISAYSKVSKLENVVTVSDSTNFIRDHNGVIQVNEKSGRYVFVLDIAKIERSIFKVSSKLVELAERVY
jgi:hypothetical protein